MDVTSAAAWGQAAGGFIGEVGFPVAVATTLLVERIWTSRSVYRLLTRIEKHLDDMAHGTRGG